MKNYFMKRHATFTIVFPPSERSIKVCTKYGTALGDDVGVTLKKPAAKKGGEKNERKVKMNILVVWLKFLVCTDLLFTHNTTVRAHSSCVCVFDVCVCALFDLF